MKLNKKHLPFYAASVQTIQYGLAGWLLLGWLGIPTVGSMGALVSFSTAYATSQISDIAKGRRLASYIALGLMMVFSPVLIGTATFLHLTQIDNTVWRGIVCAVWGFLPDGATALSGFIAGKSMIEQNEKPVKPTKKPKKAEVSQSEPALAEVKPALFCKVAGCSGNPKTPDGSFGSQSALNAHGSKHKPVAYSVSLIEPITKEQATK